MREKEKRMRRKRKALQCPLIAAERVFQENPWYSSTFKVNSLKFLPLNSYVICLDIIHIDFLIYSIEKNVIFAS